MYGLCEQWNQTHAYRRFLHCKYYKDNFDPKKIINQLEEELASMHTNWNERIRMFSVFSDSILATRT